MRQGASEPAVLALDVGTTGVRAVLVDAAGALRGSAYREVLPVYPAPGLVEHELEPLFTAVCDVIRTVLNAGAAHVRGLGIANQRGTAVVWETATGRAVHDALSGRTRVPPHAARR